MWMLPCVGINDGTIVTPIDGDAVGSNVGSRVEFAVSLYMDMFRKSMVISESISPRCVLC